MVEPCRFCIRKAGLVHAENGAAITVRADGQADHAFMSAQATFAVMPRPAELDRLTRRDMQHGAGHTVPPLSGSIITENHGPGRVKSS